MISNGVFTVARTETGTGTGNKCVEVFTLHLNQDRGRELLSPIALVPVPGDRDQEQMGYMKLCVSH